LATVHTFFLRPKNPLANSSTRFLRARDATWFTERGIHFLFLVVGVLLPGSYSQKPG
jgi:hypothetical protein